jgi:MFS family permease
MRQYRIKGHKWHLSRRFSDSTSHRRNADRRPRSDAYSVFVKAAAAKEETVSPWRPLANHIFRALWIAALVSDIGSWMHEVGEAWLMTSLSTSPLLMGMLQSADSLAILLLALPAGALADVVDRRRLAILTQGALLFGAGLLSILTLTHHITPARLIGLTFVMGIGAGMDGPVWQAIVPEVVPRKDLPSAITLGGLSYNLARAVGPALGGLVVAAAGPFAVFLLNAVTSVYAIAVLVRWRRPPMRRSAPAERWLSAMRSGLRQVRHSSDLVAVLVRTGISVLGTSCLLALLPLFARTELGVGSLGYGMLMGCMGAGAILAATVLLPRARGKLSTDGVLVVGALAFGAALLGLAASRTVWVAGTALVVAGLASMSIVSTLNLVVQVSSPPWIRARVLSVYLLVFQGAIAFGSLCWGALANQTSLRTAMIAGAVAMFVGVTARIWYRLGADEHDFSPSSHWAKPMLVYEPSLDDGPVLITVEYRVPRENVPGFLDAAAILGTARKRFGVLQWEIYRDPAIPDRFVETYLVESWAEHLRQHERVTVEEQAAEQQVRAQLCPGVDPLIVHLVAARNTIPDVT